MTPEVLVTGFNRPDLLAERLKQLRHFGVRRAFVALDGPRPDRPDDREATEDCRRVLEGTAGIEIVSRIRTVNLGCRDAMIDAISWFFSQVPEGAIVEDDVALGASFLPFCGRLLDLHREDSEVAMVAGYVNPELPSATTYGFARVLHIWGWATWADRWAWMSDARSRYRRAPSTIRMAAASRSLAVANAARNRAVWAAAGVNTWDFWWNTCVTMRGGLVAVPPRPLVQNVGGDDRATHTWGMASTPPAAEVALPAQRLAPRVDPVIDRLLLGRLDEADFDVRYAIPPELLRGALAVKRLLRRTGMING